MIIYDPCNQLKRNTFILKYRLGLDQPDLLEKLSNSFSSLGSPSLSLLCRCRTFSTLPKHLCWIHSPPYLPCSAPRKLTMRLQQPGSLALFQLGSANGFRWDLEGGRTMGQIIYSPAPSLPVPCRWAISLYLKATVLVRWSSPNSCLWSPHLPLAPSGLGMVVVPPTASPGVMHHPFFFPRLIHNSVNSPQITQF